MTLLDKILREIWTQKYQWNHEKWTTLVIEAAICKFLKLHFCPNRVKKIDYFVLKFYSNACFKSLKFVTEDLELDVSTFYSCLILYI